MATRSRTFTRPAGAAVVSLVLLLAFGPQPRALSLLDSLVSTTEDLLAPLEPLVGSVTGLVGKLSGDLEQLLGGAADEPVRVIVQTYEPPDSGDLGLLRLLGGVLGTTWTGIRGYAATVPLGGVLQLAADPNVERVSLDAPVRAHLDVARSAAGVQRAAALSGGWGSGLTGKGIGVALIDTGVQAHADFKRSLLSKQVLEIEIVGHESGLADHYGHGTHVAGILYGNGAASRDDLSFRTFTGVAPGAHLISIRALAPDGTGQTSDIITAIDWVIRNARSYNIRVLNLSLGHPVYESYRTDPLCRAVAAAVRRGIVVVVAAGNDGAIGTGFGTITSPGNSPAAITVGATDDWNTAAPEDDVLAAYSSRGPGLIDFVVKPDLVAPGTWLVSARAAGSWLDTRHHELTLQVGDYRNDPARAAEDGAYFTLSGTSMAAPMVAGTAALMLQKEPGLDPATVKARLMKSAIKDERLVFETGAGTLDAHGAVTATGTARDASSPLATAGEDGLIYIQNTAYLWGSSWPQGAIWGDGKGRIAGAPLAEVPGSTTSGSGAIWSGIGGVRAYVDNPAVTGSGAIWSGGRSSLLSTTGTVAGEGAVWVGDGRYRK